MNQPLITQVDSIIRLQVEPHTNPDNPRFAALTVTNGWGTVTVTLDRAELRALIGDAVAVWGELGQPDDRWQGARRPEAADAT